MTFDDLIETAGIVLDRARAQGLRVATVESCTGGLIAGALTAVAGSSDVVDRGFVTYSNDAKTAMVGVPAALIASEGAVSRPVAEAMATGGIANSLADLAVSVTGIAGPGGATATKPVGLVHFACARRNGTVVHRRHVFGGDRQAVRLQSVAAALDLLLDALAN
ncbi:CinA family protein [Tistrella sp. BH-R2-4]|uniref:CinA family protein n=1 Tax=Tistrella arctica TaxID=3133430 RepID=A0ABU9YEX5_9PROT